MKEQVVTALTIVVPVGHCFLLEPRLTPGRRGLPKHSARQGQKSQALAGHSRDVLYDAFYVQGPRRYTTPREKLVIFR